MPVTKENPVAVKLTRYLDGLLERLADRLAPKVAARLDAATLDVMQDPQLVADLERADLEADEDAKSYDQIRRELGLA